MSDRASGELADYSVLVVEDDRDGREMLVELLEQHGARVRAATDGREAIAAFERERPELIISDLYMPRADGFALIEHVRRRPFDDGGLTPAIAITAGTDTESDALRRGFHCWFPKPLDLLGLLGAVRSFAEARATSDGPPSARITVMLREPGRILVACVEHSRVADVRMMTRAIRAHLAERGAHRIVVDLRGHGGTFDLAAPWVAQREMWDVRHAIEGVHLVGGPLRSQMVTRATSALLGIPCTAGDDLSPHQPTEST